MSRAGHILTLFLASLSIVRVLETPLYGTNQEHNIPTTSVALPPNERDISDMVMWSLKEPEKDTAKAEPSTSTTATTPPTLVTSMAHETPQGLNTARFRFLDKTFAKVFSRVLAINNRYRWGTLDIHVLRCHALPTRERGGTLAFVEIYDTASTLMPTLIFKGWMSSLYPGVSGVDHPLYDVWLEGCDTPT